MMFRGCDRVAAEQLFKDTKKLFSKTYTAHASWGAADYNSVNIARFADFEDLLEKHGFKRN